MASATTAEMTAIDAFNDRLRADGHWILAAGLAAPDTAVVIDHRDGAATTTDGPHIASVEYVSGFWIVDAPDRNHALSLGVEASRACNRQVEVRALSGGDVDHSI